jgi:hypothetical protein
MERSIEYSHIHDYSKQNGSVNTHFKSGPPSQSLSTILSVPVTNKRSNSSCESDVIQLHHNLSSKRKKIEQHSTTDNFDFIHHGVAILQPIQDMSLMQIESTTNMQNNMLKLSDQKHISDIIQDLQMNDNYEAQQTPLNTSSSSIFPYLEKLHGKCQPFSSTSFCRKNTVEREIQMHLSSDSHHIRNQKNSDEKHHVRLPASLLDENPIQPAMLSKQSQLPACRAEAQINLPTMTFNKLHNDFNSKYLSQYLLGLLSSNRLLAHSNTFDWILSCLSSLSPIGKDLVMRVLMDQSSHLLSSLDIQNILQGTAYSTYLTSHQIAQQVLLQELLASQNASRFLPQRMSAFRPNHKTTRSDVLQSLQTETNTTKDRRVARHSSNGIASEYNFDSEEGFYSLLHQHTPMHGINGAHAAACRHHGADGRESAKTVSGEYKIPESLPIALSLPDDANKLSPLQVLLRQQIEIFAASDSDLMTHARGRNKPITLKQVGIRCRHSARLPLKEQKRGAVYFPFTLLGIYQAAQNMASSHFTQDNCSEISSETRLKLLECSLGCKSAVGLGKYYWANLAMSQGLFDTDHGIRFIGNY